MLGSIIKIISCLFFAYVSIDSFFILKRINRDVEKDLLNPKTAQVFRRRSVISGILAFLVSMISLGALWFEVPFLD